MLLVMAVGVTQGLTVFASLPADYSLFVLGKLYIT